MTSNSAPRACAARILQGVDITLRYDQADGRWLRLESALVNGRVMRYPLARPDQLASSQALTTDALQ